LQKRVLKKQLYQNLKGISESNYISIKTINSLGKVTALLGLLKF